MTPVNRKTITLKDSIIKDILDPIFTKNLKNRQSIMDMVVQVFSTSELALLIEIFTSSTIYNPFVQYGYVKIIPKNGWLGSRYEADILKDMGLLADDGCIYGEIINDDHWNDEGFNCFHDKFKVDVFFHEENEPKICRDQILLKATELEPISKNSIKYFKVKPQNNGTDINTSSKQRVSKVE